MITVVCLFPVSHIPTAIHSAIPQDYSLLIIKNISFQYQLFFLKLRKTNVENPGKGNNRSEQKPPPVILLEQWCYPAAGLANCFMA